MRAAGQGLAVCVIQFIKGKWQTGEGKAFQALADNVEFHVKGSGFTWQEDDKEQVVQVARQAFDFAREKILSGLFDMVVLDELTYLISYKMIEVDEVVSLISERPSGLHIVITGRDAHAKLIEAADLVTEMRLIKHPYQAGIPAQKGIEF